jgi:hypothetical protein
MWLSRHVSTRRPKKAASRRAEGGAWGTLIGNRGSEIDAAAGVEEIEVVEWRPYALQLAVWRYRRIAGHEVNLGREVLIHRIEVHIGRVDRLIESERPASNLGAGDLGRDLDVGEGASLEEAIGRDLAEIAAVAVAAGAKAIDDLLVTAPEGGVAEGRQEAELALDAQFHFPGFISGALVPV